MVTQSPLTRKQISRGRNGKRDYLAHATFYDPLIDSLIRRRYALAFSQAELNWRIGCTDGLIAKWESRVCYPSAYHLMLWAAALGMVITTRSNGEEP